MAFNKDSVSGTLIVALLVCLVCGVIVSTAAVSLRPLQEANKVLDRQLNILKAAGKYEPGMDVEAEFEKVERRFVELATGDYVERPDSYDARMVLNDASQSRALSASEDIARIRRVALVNEVYLGRDDQGNLESIIIPVSGYGLWSTMHGFLALEADVNTISGLVFYEHGETPGLGGEIDNPRWQAQWEGKQVWNERGEMLFEVVKGSAEGQPNADYKVDGLSGATLTSVGVSNMVRFWLGDQGFGKYLARLRSERAAEATVGDDSVPADVQY